MTSRRERSLDPALLRREISRGKLLRESLLFSDYGGCYIREQIARRRGGGCVIYCLSSANFKGCFEVIVGLVDSGIREFSTFALSVYTSNVEANLSG